jgi:hypothetical protein
MTCDILDSGQERLVLRNNDGEQRLRQWLMEKRLLQRLRGSAAEKELRIGDAPGR